MVWRLCGGITNLKIKQETGTGLQETLVIHLHFDFIVTLVQ